MFRGNDQERETARQRLDELLTKNRMTWGDVSRLIALSHSNPETTRNDSEGEDEPPGRLALLSPTRGCGKSVTVNLLAKLRPRARKLGSETTAILPRLIDRDAPTLLLDEADNLNFAKDAVLCSIVNDGFENGGVRMLMINGELREFRLFAPLTFGAIGRLPRTVDVALCRDQYVPRAEKRRGLERLNLKNPTLLAELDFVYRQVFDWAQKIRGQLNTDPAMPCGFASGRRLERAVSFCRTSTGHRHVQSATPPSRLGARSSSSPPGTIFLPPEIAALVITGGGATRNPS
jgi:hypothetical protein